MRPTQSPTASRRTSLSTRGAVLLRLTVAGTTHGGRRARVRHLPLRTDCTGTSARNGRRRRAVLLLLLLLLGLTVLRLSVLLLLRLPVACLSPEIWVNLPALLQAVDQSRADDHPHLTAEADRTLPDLPMNTRAAVPGTRRQHGPEWAGTAKRSEVSCLRRRLLRSREWPRVLRLERRRVSRRDCAHTRRVSGPFGNKGNRRGSGNVVGGGTQRLDGQASDKWLMERRLTPSSSCLCWCRNGLDWGTRAGERSVPSGGSFAPMTEKCGGVAPPRPDTVRSTLL